MLLVVAHHWLALRNPPFDLGLTGVRLFFALSGFLITTVLLDGRDAMARGESSLGRVARSFYARRALRIAPLYYAVLAGLFAVDVVGVRSEAVWHLCYATNFLVALRDHWIGLASHFWSLSVEEQFYLLWPWVVLKVPARWLRATLVAVVLAGPLWRSAGLLAGLGRFSLMYLLPGSLDALGIGAVLAYVHRVTPAMAPRVRRVLWITGALLLAFATAVTRGAGATVATHLAGAHKGLAWALLLGACVSSCAGQRSALAQAMTFAPLRYVGRVSYAVYIVHPLVGRALESLDVAPANAAARVALYSLVTLALASLSWVAFEGPLNAQKRRFPYRDPALRKTS